MYMKNSQLTSLPTCGFIAQLVEHRTGIAEVTGSNPVEALIFFQASLFQLLKLEIHCEDHISPSYMWINDEMNEMILAVCKQFKVARGYFWERRCSFLNRVFGM